MKFLPIVAIIIIVVAVAIAIFMLEKNAINLSSSSENQNQEIQNQDNKGNENMPPAKTNSDGIPVQDNSPPDNSTAGVKYNVTEGYKPIVPLLPPKAMNGDGSGGSSSGSGSSGSSSSNTGNPWYVPIPYIPNPPVSLFTNPEAQPLDDLTIYAFDIGTDSFFIDTSVNDVLTDAGTQANGLKVINYLSQLNKSNIDIVIASDHDASHLEGLIPIISSTNITWVLDSGSSLGAEAYHNYIQRAAAKNLTRVGRGDLFQIAPEVWLQILNPSILTTSNEKDNSIVYKLVFQDFAMLFMGDCTVGCEQDLLTSGLSLKADILKLGNHGGIESTSQAFLNAVNPTSVIISVGPNLTSQYNYPDQNILDMLDAKDIIIYRTDRDGNIVITTNGISYQVLKENN
jgi:competence protein ComEC